MVGPSFLTRTRSYMHEKRDSHSSGRLSISREGSPHNSYETISAHKVMEEETNPKYNPHSFYPAKFGEVLNGRYKIIAKLGYGVTATVWLAQDLHAQHRSGGVKHVTVKINVNTLTENFLDSRRKIAETLVSKNAKHPGYNHVRFMLDTFKIKSTGVLNKNSTHLCVVYDVLREPLDDCMRKFDKQRFSSASLRILVPALLKGLDYMHSECHVVHTDLKPDNVMMGLGDPKVLEKFIQDEKDHPSKRKAPDSHGRVIYESRSDFGAAPSDAVIASAKITDLGLAAWGDEENNYSIQSNAFTAPEVLLAAHWSYPADIWNLGVVLWDLLEYDGLFDRIDTRPGKYKADKHLGLMIALMGPPPKELLDRGDTAPTYFDENGEFRYPKLIPEDFSFESSINRIRGRDKELFIDFAKKMICWLPEERWTAKQLLDHPWLTESPAELRPEDIHADFISKLKIEDEINSFAAPRRAATFGSTPPRTPTTISTRTSSSTTHPKDEHSKDEHPKDEHPPTNGTPLAPNMNNDKNGDNLSLTKSASHSGTHSSAPSLKSIPSINSCTASSDIIDAILKRR